MLQDAYDEMSRAEVRLFEAELRRIEGELQLLAGRPTEADQCFAAAVQVAREQGARSFELRASVSLARLWRDLRRYTDAYNLLDPIHAWFTEGLDTPDLTDASELLHELRCQNGL